MGTAAPVPQATREVEPAPGGVSVSRRFVASQLMEWGLGRFLETAVLLTSELVTNAVFHGEPPILVTIEGGGGHVRIEVRDGAPSLPSRLDAAPLDDRGRGLTLVSELSTRWGAEQGPGAGKTVWFEIHGEGRPPARGRSGRRSPV